MQETGYRERERARRERIAFLDGAESGMVEVRGYGLTAAERAEAEAEADRLYGPEPTLAVA